MHPDVNNGEAFDLEREHRLNEQGSRAFRDDTTINITNTSAKIAAPLPQRARRVNKKLTQGGTKKSKGDGRHKKDTANHAPAGRSPSGSRDHRQRVRGCPPTTPRVRRRPLRILSPGSNLRRRRCSCRPCNQRAGKPPLRVGGGAPPRRLPPRLPRGPNLVERGGRGVVGEVPPSTDYKKGGGGGGAASEGARKNSRQ